ncbi:MAG: tryptophan--tRNA ligase [Chitinophagales bacterium]|nr:tryptophan--tRNA ligase [Chitinophagales bacterium]
MAKQITVSGVRPTGRQHLGNYFGAVLNFVKMQEEYNGYFFVADYHSLTTHPKPEDLKANVKQIVVEYLACGVDPNKCILYLQSDLPQIPELYLIFNMFAYLGELERAATFKEKVRSQPNNVNAGLLTYPVLMAVDIVIHKAAKVPVGKDQQQHLEMTRDFVARFNNLYGVQYFPEPEAFNYDSSLISIPSLDGEGKMSKSKGEHTCIYLADEPEALRKKIMRAKTDTGPTVPNSPKPQEIQNLFDLMRLVSSSDTVRFFDDKYNDCTIRYGDMKKQLAEDMVNYLTPIRIKIEELSANDKLLNEIINDGGNKARQSAAQTLKDVREIIGIKSFGE